MDYRSIGSTRDGTAAVLGAGVGGSGGGFEIPGSVVMRNVCDDSEVEGRDSSFLL